MHYSINNSIKTAFRFLFFLTCFSSQALAQKHFALEGNVVDPKQEVLEGATVLLLDLPDSTMVEFAMSNEKGKFIITAPKSDEYLLQISFIGYQTYEKVIALNQKLDLGTITLEEEIENLNAIEVTEERIPIKIKGDTIEYNADAFGSQEHDVVEDLLQKLPGVEVEENGEIKAQGENVSKILVDGKDFFGENKEAVTKNLPADAVDKVEVYDRKSDMAEFSGVEDGKKLKTINIKLKEDRKDGFFGNIEGGYGYPGHRYKGKLNLNYFNDKMRLSAIGAINNINERAFEFGDYINLMGGIKNFMNGDGGININMSGDNGLGALMMNNQQGLSRVLGGGLNFNLFANEKTEFSAYYFYSNIYNDKEENTFSRSIATNSFLNRNSFNESQYHLGNHNLRTKLEHKIDSSQKLRWQLNMSLKNNHSLRNILEQTAIESDLQSNEINQQFQSQNKGWNANTNLLYRKKFSNKKGRVLVANLTAGLEQSDAMNNNTNNTFLYSDSTTVSDTINILQKQNTASFQHLYDGSLSFVEPVGKHNFLEFKLSGGAHFDTKDQRTDDIIGNTTIPNSNLTNLFQRNYNYQRFTTRFQRSKKGTTFTAAASLQRSFLQGIFSETLPSVQRDYYYPLGMLSVDIKINKSSSFMAAYKSSIQEPRVNQLQPILNNSNPLLLSVGNQNLTPEYQHNINLRYSLFDRFNFSNLFFNANVQLIQQQIVNTQTISSDLITTYKPENTPFGLSSRLSVNYGRPLKSLGIKFNVSVSGNLNYQTTFVNAQANELLRQSYRFGLMIGNRKKKVIDLRVGTNINLNNSTFSVNSSLNTNFINYTAYANFRLAFAKRWEFKTNFNAKIYTDPAFENDIFIPMWSASISCMLLKSKSLRITLSAHNLLDQTQFANRFNYEDSITERISNTLGRYFMLTVAYKIKQFGKKDPNSGIIMMNE